ncbi:MAG: N-formylglutamate amidohydrolase [Nannocystaceae bacterium]
MHAADDLRSLPGICDLSWHPPRDGLGDGPRPALLIEIPHGATEIADYEAVAAGLRSTLPPELEAFFYVNTDIGAPECAERVAAALCASDRPVGVLVARCRIPRTFIDCNRVAAGIPGVVVDGLTPAVASYVDDAADKDVLEDSHRRYHELVSRAYARVCGGGGLALQLHSYAPVSVDIPVIDRDIVDKLRWAYSPEVFPRWGRRPDVDVICESVDGAELADAALVDGLLRAYRELGLEVGASATYRLHPATMGYHYARRFPGQVLCVELSRGRLADPFVPLARSPLSTTEIERLAGPLTKVLGAALTGGGGGGFAA